MKGRIRLKGPPNDVRLFQSALLDVFGVPKRNIVCLTSDPSDSESRSTKGNIVREFRRLEQTVRAGDQIVILLSGHGTRLPLATADPSEPDGLNEAFLPEDVGVWNEGRKEVDRPLLDDEFRDLLKALSTKGAFVWVIFDCCHSGTMMRGAPQYRDRYLSPHDVLGVPTEHALRSSQKRADYDRQPSGSACPFEVAGLEPCRLVLCLPTIRSHAGASSAARK